MKLLLGIVSLVAVFTVNGQDFHNEPAGGDTANEADDKDLHFQDESIGDNSFEESQNLLGGLELQDFEKQDYQLQEKKGDLERTLRRSRCKARNACVVMGGFCVTNATLCSGRLVAEGCKGTNCQCCVPGTIEAKFDNFEQELQFLKDNMNAELKALKVNMNTELQYIKVNMNNTSSNLNSELGSLKDNMNTSNSNLNTNFQILQNNMNNSNSNLNTELQSIKVNMNTSNSNLNTELQSLKNNMNTSNSNLNTELQSLKNNMNNGNSNTNIELRSLKYNMNSSNSNLNRELQSLKNNMNTGNYNINTELQSLKNNMNNTESNLNTELQSLKNNVNTGNSNLNTELQSLKNNMNTGNSNLNTKIQSLKINMDTSFSNVNSKVENKGCPEGLFLFAPSNQCFKLLVDRKRNWDTAKAACSALGLHLAHPFEPISLRSYLLTKYGLGNYCWIGARGTGSSFKWQRTGKSISNTNPFWWTGKPGSAVSTSSCLALETYDPSWKSKPNQPYWNYSCSMNLWTLCELVSE